MATLSINTTFTASAGQVSTGAYSVALTDDLTVTDPSQASRRVAVTNVGGSNIILPASSSKSYIWIKNLALTAADAASTKYLDVETTGDVLVARLAAGEFLFMPAHGTIGIQLQAEDSTSILAEYAIFTAG